MSFGHKGSLLAVRLEGRTCRIEVAFLHNASVFKLLDGFHLLCHNTVS